MMVVSVSQIKEVKATHQLLREQVSELVLLAHSHDADSKIFPQFVRRIVKILEARAGFLWTFSESGNLTCLEQHYSATENVEVLNSLRPDKAALVNHASSKAGGIVSSRLPAGHRQEAMSDAVLAIWVVPIHRQGKPWGVIEVIPTSNVDEKFQAQGLQIIRHMARVLSQRVSMQATKHPNPMEETRIAPETFTQHSTKPIRQPTPTQTQQKQAFKGSSAKHLNEVALSFHESLGLEVTAMVIVNEFRRLLRCDRVSLILKQGTRWSVLAISGQELINHRADVVYQLRRIAASVKDVNSPSWFQSSKPEQAAKLSMELNALYGPASWHEVGIIPLKPIEDSTNAGSIDAMLLVEYLSPDRESDVEKTIEIIAPHAAAALVNAREHNQVLFLKLWKTLGHIKHALMSSSRRKLATIAGSVMLILAFLTFYPVSFHIQGKGHLLPAKRRDVFTDARGVVTAIHVAHGDVVQEGDVLLELRNTDLDVELAQTLGKRRSAEEQLTSIQRLRHTDSISQAEETRLAGQAFQLQEQLSGLQEQLLLLQEKKERLIVRSPMAGQVTTWNVQRQLMLRPVLPGQVLITIADQTGPWNLEVYLPETEVGHLISSANGQDHPEQKVEFLVASQPTITHAGLLTQMDNHAQLYEEFGHAVRALIKLDRDAVPSAPAGTTVTAHINCGQKSIGFVWFHRLAEFVHTRILFPLF